MRYVKMLGLAALAALALMAVVGAGTASAKVCSTAGAGPSCGGSHGNAYTGPIKGSGVGNVILTSGFITVTCASSALEGEVANSNSPASGNITKLSLASCTNNINGGACSASTTAAPLNKWPTSIATGTVPNGSVTLQNVSGSFICNVLGANRTCFYGTADAGGKGEIGFRGGAQAQIVATNVPLGKEAGSDALCSNTASWSGTYTINTPANAYLT